MAFWDQVCLKQWEKATCIKAETVEDKGIMMSDAERLRELRSERTTGFLSAYCAPNLAQQWTVAVTPGAASRQSMEILGRQDSSGSQRGFNLISKGQELN